MDYRTSVAETEEQKAKERGFYGLGLTSRKNLCLHPEVSLDIYLADAAEVTAQYWK
jgi:hypothetical protein